MRKQNVPQLYNSKTPKRGGAALKKFDTVASLEREFRTLDRNFSARTFENSLRREANRMNYAKSL